ncbi:zinc finger protein 318-like [Paralichthys olivaceus]|uniref:zinc finger protein 318-like n=1 Tax=Paralichthys olivaceus TaxID=8255 RepID=UPI003752F363
MDPHQWGGDLRRLQKHLDQSDSDVRDSMRNTSRPDDGCGYSRYTADDAHNSNRGSVAEEMNDEELVRKCDELREIQQKIILKKAALALKTLEPGFSSDAETRNGESLRDRVNLILQQRHSLGVLPKILSPKRRLNSSKDALLLEDHPLKLRVKALMKQRCSVPRVLPSNTEALDVTPPPPSQRVTSPAREETCNMGFQRFLSILNKGVDINLLSRIVNEDGENLDLGEELLNIEPSAVEDKSEMGESQGSHSSASLPRCSGTDGGGRETSLPSREKSLNDRPSLCGDEEKNMNEKGDDSLCFSRESHSPPAVKKKKKKEEEPPKVDEQHEQLQNILKTLGLSLEVEEMSKLADRTQERLYGKKPEGRVDAGSRVEQESRQRGSDRQCRSSSSSSSSSSRSTSRNYIPSISRQCPSHTWYTKQKQESECSNSGDGNQDSEEAQRARDIDDDRGETSSYLYQYLQEQAYCNAHPAALSEFSDYSLSQCSGYTDYDGATTNSYSTYTQGVAPPPLDVRGYPHPPVTDHDFPGSVVAPNIVYPRRKRSKRKSSVNLLVNPDLSTSEGQAGSAGQRCLQVIRTKSTPQHFIKQLVSERKMNTDHKGNRQTWIRPVPEAPIVKKNHSKAYHKRMAILFNKKPAMRKKKHLEEGDLKTEQPKDDKRPPPEDKRPPRQEDQRPSPEEEIKVNLRKKLEAFNQKVKRQVPQPANSRTTHNESLDYQDLI